MTNIFIIHGTFGHPKENWFPWLKSELEKLGHQVFVPKFTTPKNQTLNNWLKIFEEYQNQIENSIVIGHSLGVAFLLNILETKSVQAAFFVAGVSSPLDNEFDENMKTFSHRQFDWNKIKNNCQKFYVFHSDNDPYIPLEKAEELAKNLGVDLIIVKNAGHFNELAGYIKFDLLLEKIKQLTSSQP
ncbi:MAG: serine hydrolase family protein [Nanoarchaeota archaeon]|nr:serine hydrolase family protein [Nanoarchaeota archaeon]